MPRPAGGYRIDGEPVPGISTVAEYGKPCEGLKVWAHRLGLRGIDMDSELAREAGIGTLAHGLFDAFLLKRPAPSTEGYTDEQIAKAMTSFGAARSWAEQSRLEVTHTELTLYSKTLRVAGTLDAAVRILGKRAIADWKTTKGLYPEAVVQVKGYGMVWDENFPEDQVDGGYHLVRFDKETGGFEHRWWPELANAGRAFIRKRELWDLRTLRAVTQ